MDSPLAARSQVASRDGFTSWLEWTPPPGLDDKLAGLLALAEAVLAADDVPVAEQRRLLREWLLWKRTEASGNPGQYDLRYYSTSAVAHRLDHGTAGLRHEHVFTRKSLADELLAAPRSAARLLRTKAVACVVTEQEAAKLNTSKEQGWLRYKNSGIEVSDRGTGEVLDFDEPHYGNYPGPTGLPGPAPLTRQSRDVRLVSDSAQIRRARLAKDGDHYTLSWSHGKIWVAATPHRYPHKILTELSNLLPSGTQLTLCGTCTRLVLSGMALDMGGGHAGYCTLATASEIDHLVRLDAPGCNHHPAWPHPEPVIAGPQAAPRGSDDTPAHDCPPTVSLAVDGGAALLRTRRRQPWTLRSPAGNRRLAPAEGRASLALVRACPRPTDPTCDCHAHHVMRDPVPTAQLLHAAHPSRENDAAL